MHDTTTPEQNAAVSGSASTPLLATPLDVVLGNGDKVVSDIHNAEEGWGGFCISDGDCPIGDVIETGAETDNDLGAFMRIRTTNPESLDVIIAACERAKARMAGCG